jgi:hypothetical protein
MTRIRLPAIALGFLISSSAWADLRTYDVDFQYRQEVLEALQGTLITDPSFVLSSGGRYGRVRLLPSGQLLVEAAPDTLDQVEQVIRAIKARPVAPAPRVSLRYWVLIGTSPSVNTPQQSTPVVIAADAQSTTPVPSMLTGVLDELKRAHGELTFRVLGTAAVASESGQGGAVNGVPLNVRQRAYVQGQTLNASINLELKQYGSSIAVDATLARGEFLVLGENTLQDSGLYATLFYIVHWPENE